MTTFTRKPDSLSLVDGVGVTYDLNSIMEFDHVIQVHVDGTVTEPDGFYAPDVDSNTTEHVSGWTLLSGSGQHAYSGPIMHPSEFIGHGLARRILETPGLYVVTEVRDAETGEFPEGDPIGWVIAHRETTAA